MELKGGVKTFYAKTQADWRNWLKENHQTEKSVWLIIYRKGGKTPSVYYPEAVDEALCFGWIDSLPNKRDEESYYQFFAKRNPKSNWSKVNKMKMDKLLAEGKIEPAGLEAIELAKQNGKWNILDEVAELIMPEELKLAFDKNPLALENFNNFSKSSKRGILEWILNAKREETKQKRIEETVSLASKNVKANHPRQ